MQSRLLRYLELLNFDLTLARSSGRFGIVPGALSGGDRSVELRLPVMPDVGTAVTAIAGSARHRRRRWLVNS